jgi:hypothetical protein
MQSKLVLGTRVASLFILAIDRKMIERTGCPCNYSSVATGAVVRINIGAVGLLMAIMYRLRSTSSWKEMRQGIRPLLCDSIRVI